MATKFNHYSRINGVQTLITAIPIALSLVRVSSAQNLQPTLESSKTSQVGDLPELESGNIQLLQQDIQGNQHYQNPQTGEVTELPYTGSSGLNQGGGWNSEALGQLNDIDPGLGLQEMQVLPLDESQIK